MPGKPVILCVDDEQVILDSLKILLKGAFSDSYLYEFAQSAEEALEIIHEVQSDETPVLVIVSDWLMPGTKGDEFLIKVHQKFPNIVKIMLTGQADQEAIERAQELASLHCCVYKPWDSRDLIDKIKSGLKKL